MQSILTAPVIVAYGINMQYYFSAVCPNEYGSGDKTLHNVIENVGVMDGNQSDLKIGLPKQSVFLMGNHFHIPTRLFVYVYAPKATVHKIINQCDKLKQLIEGHWFFLHIIEPYDD